MSGEILSKKELTGFPGVCLKCGELVASYTCNAEIIDVRPEAAHWDYWYACTNGECMNHQGEGAFLEGTMLWWKPDTIKVKPSLDSCQCVDCGGNEPGHSSDCKYMAEISGYDETSSKVPRTLEFHRSTKGTPLERYWSAIGKMEEMEQELFEAKERDQKHREIARLQLARQCEELEELRRWKAEAMESFPDWQVIGEELNLHIGADVKDHILPGIRALKQALRELLAQRHGASVRARKLLQGTIE